MKSIKTLITAAGLLIAIGAGAQSQGQMRLNEYLVINTHDFQDDFGEQNGWIELFNSSYGTVDIGGCYLSDDPDNLKKYQIPGGDIQTKIKPRQHILFWADNEPYRGTFHVNFDLLNADEIIFTKGDGKSVIDRIKIRPELKNEAMANKSYGRIDDGIGSITGDGEGWDFLERTSPSTNNCLVDKTAKPEKMRQMDPHGWMMAVLAMSVVFLALIILYLIFKFIGNINKSRMRKEEEKAKKAAVENSKATGASGKSSSDEVYAAIAMAMHQWIEENEAHDEESFVLTINKYETAWNSRLQMLGQLPKFKK